MFFRVYWPRAHRRYVSGEMCSSRAHSRGRRSGAARPRSWEGYIREHAFGRRPPPEFGARGRAAPAVRLQNKSGRTLPDQILYARINSEGRRPTEFGTRGWAAPPSAFKTRARAAPPSALKINSGDKFGRALPDRIWYAGVDGPRRPPPRFTQSLHELPESFHESMLYYPANMGRPAPPRRAAHGARPRRAVRPDGRHARRELT